MARFSIWTSKWLRCCVATLLITSIFAASCTHAATILATSVLPVSAYTRITIESDEALSYSVLMLKNPNRIVLDIENIKLNQTLKMLPSHNLHDDALISQLRVGKFKQNITRVVVDLKTLASASANSHAPAGDYQYRLTLDIAPISDSVLAESVDAPPSENQTQKMPASKQLRGLKRNAKPNNNVQKNTNVGTGIILVPNSTVELEPELDIETNPQ
jgi:N-acetylmuramoyl-L-alanine amidase